MNIAAVLAALVQMGQPTTFHSAAMTLHVIVCPVGGPPEAAEGTDDPDKGKPKQGQKDG